MANPGTKTNPLSEHDEEILSALENGEFSTKIELAKNLISKYNLNMSDSAAINYMNRLVKERLSDREIVAENVRLAKTSQKQLDMNRIKNKSFREYARIENAVEELAASIKEQNKSFGKELAKIKVPSFKKANQNSGTGVIQFSDLHFNELIDLKHNRYDFEIAAKRLRLHVLESIEYFKSKNVSKVLAAFTGDLINSSRRLDEILSASTNQSKALVLSVHLLKQAIMELRSHFPVSIVGVLGNEARLDQEMTFSKEALSHNYDFTILAQLHQIFEFAKIKDVNFISYQNVEEIVKIEDQKWLLCHNLSKQVDDQKSTQSTMGRYSLAGNNIDFIIGGHIHATRITDISARSASMAGSNTYNEHALNLQGRASQNCFVVKGNKRYTQINDLQHTENVKGYEIISQLAVYNAKSASKTSAPKVIMQIVI